MRGTRCCGKERAEAGFSVLWPTYEDGVSGVPRSPLCVRAIRASGERVRWLYVDFLAHSSQLTACCVAIQWTLLEHRRRQAVAPQLRIGLDSGSAQQHESGYRGKGVHVAARHRSTCRGRRDPGKRGNSLTPRRTSHALPSSRIPLSALQLFWPADRLLTRQGTYLIGWNGGRSLEFDLRPIFRRDRAVTPIAPLAPPPPSLEAVVIAPSAITPPSWAGAITRCSRFWACSWKDLNRAWPS